MHPRPFRPAILCLFLLAVSLLAPTAARAQAAPPGLVGLAARLDALLKQGDANGAAALAERPEAVAWLKRPAPEEKDPWRVTALMLPQRGGPPRPAVVFSRFHVCESTGDHVLLARNPGRGWRLTEEIPETDTLGYRVRDHQLTVRYDPPAHIATFTDALTLERTEERAGLAILRLSSDMTVDSLTLDGQPLPFQHAPGILAIVPPAGRTATLSLAYHGRIDHPGSDYVNEKEAVLVSYWYPHIARLPATMTVTATVPKGWLAIGVGDLKERRDAAVNSTFTFRNEIPTCYYSLDAGTYTVTAREADGRKLAVYQLRPDPRRAESALNELQRCLRYFEASFGKFPYNHYTLVETIGPFGGALEAYSFATFAGGTFGATAHEVAHTWWGGIVPNPYTRTMWNEFFATYSDSLFRRKTGRNPDRPALTRRHAGDKRGRELLQEYAVPIRQAPDALDPEQAAVGYSKGAQVLAMLEDILTTPVMLRCMRTFIADHPRGEAADWDHFIAAVRKTTGQDYDWFFAQWLDLGGVPVVRLANVAARRSGAKHVIEADVLQDGKPYRLPLPVTLQLQNGTTLRQTLEVREGKTRLRLEADAPPKRLALDPEGTILLAGAELQDGAESVNVHLFPSSGRGNRTGISNGQLAISN